MWEWGKKPNYIQNRRNCARLKQEREKHEKHLVSIDRIADALESTQGQEQRDDDQRARREIITIGLLILTVIFTGGADLIFYWTLVDSHENATKQLTEADAALKLDQRAWLGVINITPTPRIPTIGQMFEVEVDLKNTGKTPALHVEIITVGQDIAKGNETDFTYDKFAKIKNAFIAPNATTMMQVSPVNDATGNPIPVTQDILTALQHGDLRATVHGRIDYQDIFGKPHWLLFCSILIVPFNGVLGQCPTHNGSDDYQG